MQNKHNAEQVEKSDNTPQCRLLSPWAYVGYSLLFMIPVVGLALLIVFSFGNANVNRRNFACAYWCGALVALAVAAVILTLVLTGVLPAVEKWAEEISKLPVIANFAPSSGKAPAMAIDYSKAPAGVSRELYEKVEKVDGFFDEFLAFMDRYTKSDMGVDMISEYADFMAKYGDAMGELDKIDETKLNEQEKSYLDEARQRIKDKLAKHTPSDG